MSKYEIREHRNVRSHESLPQEDISGLELCISSAFGGGITTEDARSHMTGDQILIAKHIVDGQPPEIAGFTSTTVLSPRNLFKSDELDDNPGVYFAGAAISNNHQGAGLYSTLNEQRFNLVFDNDLDTVYTRTQNPRVQEGITRSIDRLIERGDIRGYKMGRFITRGVYGKMLTAQKPVARSTVFDDLNYSQGDAAIITWYLQR